MSGNILHDIAKGGDKHNAITYLETSLNSYVLKTHRVERGISVNSFKPRLQLLKTPQFMLEMLYSIPHENMAFLTEKYKHFL